MSQSGFTRVHKGSQLEISQLENWIVTSISLLEMEGGLDVLPPWSSEPHLVVGQISQKLSILESVSQGAQEYTMVHKGQLEISKISQISHNRYVASELPFTQNGQISHKLSICKIFQLVCYQWVTKC